MTTPFFTPSLIEDSIRGDSFQKKFLEAMLHKQNVLGSFPLGYPILTLYATPALMGHGTAVVICPDRYIIQRNLETLSRMGLKFPEALALDGSQMPHEERESLQAIHHHKTRLIFTVPEKFASLTFLQLMVHVTIDSLVIEDAHFLLEGFSGSFRYRKLVDAWNALQNRPPVMLLAQSLSGKRFREINKRLGLGTCKFLHRPPSWEKTALHVALMMTQFQKLQALLKLLFQFQKEGVLSPESSQPRAAILIQAAGRKQAQWLATKLTRHGFNHVLAYHSGLKPEERFSIERSFHHQPGAIVINSGYNSRFFKPPEGQAMRMIFWDLPRSPEETYGQIFRLSDLREGSLESWLLYTKEDYNALRHKLVIENNHFDNPEITEVQRQNLKSLKKLRQWVLSNPCRRQSLVAIATDQEELSVLPCGICDRCNPTSSGGTLRFLLKHLVY